MLYKFHQVLKMWIIPYLIMMLLCYSKARPLDDPYQAKKGVVSLNSKRASNIGSWQEVQGSLCDPIILLAVKDFAASNTTEYVPYYQHTSRMALAVDASKYKGDFALAEHTFNGISGNYSVRIITLSENDGESYYRLLLNNKLVGEVQNAPNDENFSEQEHVFEQIELKKGDVIGIAFNAHTNGKIPEGEITAYSRGRWTRLILIPKCN